MSVSCSTRGLRFSLGLALALSVPSSFATNGMNMEGYGAIATGMGGASQAYDNGTAAMMNNPATLALMPEGHRADFAYGFLGPRVEAGYSGMQARSKADAFSMPAFGWMRKQGDLAYGFGVYGQGGMGTEYGGDSFMSAGSGLTTRSELSVGRMIFPVAYSISPKLSVGATLDFVWMGLDLRMAMSRAQIDAMPTLGQGSFGGSLAGSLPALLPNQSDVAYFNFSNDNRFTGQARAYGLGAKLGMVYQASPDLSIGASYHSETRVGNMHTDHAELRTISGGTVTSTSGRISVIDFQWPETYGLGIAYRASDRWLLVADYKRLQWASVMRDFRMRFDADSGGNLDLTLNQNWKNQDVWMLGAAYRASRQWTLRAGVNLANDPVDYYMHPLFPAIIKSHATLGAGYAINKDSSVDVGLAHGFKAESTNASGVTVSHRQTNFQLLYSRRY